MRQSNPTAPMIPSRRPLRPRALALVLAGLGLTATCAGLSCTENAPPADNHALAPAAPADRPDRPDSLAGQNADLLRPHTTPPQTPSADGAAAPGGDGALPSIATPPNRPHALASLNRNPDAAPASPARPGPAGNSAVDRIPLNPSRTPARPAPAPAVDNSMPDIPDGATWTIFCAAVNGPAHVEQAKQLKAYLIGLTHKKDFYIINQETESTVFFGFYKSIESRDPDGRRAQADHSALSNFAITNPADQSVTQPLKTCFLLPLDAPDPHGPPEWDLALKDRDKPFDDPNRAFWSVEVEAFAGNPRRKEAAVQRCREYRAQGFPAYYYHGENASSVCMGTWKRGAVKEQHHQSDIVRQEDTLFYLSKPLPAPIKNKLVTENGDPITIVAPQADILDPTLMQTLREHPDHAVNYDIIKHIKRMPDGTKLEYKDHSFMFIIPHPTPEEMTAQRNGQNFGDDVGFAPPVQSTGNAASAGHQLRALQGH